MSRKGLKTVSLPVKVFLAILLSVLLCQASADVRSFTSSRSWGAEKEADETKIQEIREISGINKIKEMNDGEAAEETEETKETEKTEETEETKAAEETEEAKETEAAEETAGESREEERLTVAIDPGHQGSWVNMSDLEPLGPGSSEMKAKASTGTMGRYSGKPEYELNLEISMLLRDELEARGYRVILTRQNNDTAISNAERATMAWEEGGDIYVRIHANGSDDEGVQGALAMVPSPSNPYVSYLAEDSYLLADCVLNAYCGRASFGSLGIQYYDDMSGINWSQIPVMILEMGFMTNQSDDLRMADAAVQAEMAAGIADGIDRYFTEKGMKTDQASEEQQAAADGCMERIQNEYLAPVMEDGGMWAVGLEDLETGAAAGINEEAQMPAAGVIRLFLMAAIYDRICYPASEERHIFFNEAYEGELKEKITAMVVDGDQAAAQELLTRLGQGDAQSGMAVVNQFCEENGYTGTVMKQGFSSEDSPEENLTTAKDCRRLVAAMYRGTCVGPEASAKMFAYLESQTDRNKIPQGIADTGAKVSNETGELFKEDGSCVENDAAVIETGGKAYVLCVFGEDLKNGESGQEKIREISRAVYEEMIR